MQNYFTLSDRFLTILNENAKKELSKLISFQNKVKSNAIDNENFNINNFRKLIDINKKYLDFFENYFNSKEFFMGGFKLNVSNVKEYWINKLKDIKELIFKFIIDNNVYLSKKVELEMETISKKLEEEPQTVDEYDFLVKYCENLNNHIKKIRDILESQQNNADLLEENFYMLSKEDFFRMWSCYGVPKILQSKKAETVSRLNFDRKKFKKELKVRLTDALIEISAIKNEFESNTVLNSINNYEKNYETFASLDYRINKTIKLCSILNNHQSIIGVKTEDLSEIKHIQHNFLNYYQLWDAVNDFLSEKIKWMNEPMKKTERKKLKEVYDKCVSTIDRLEKTVFKKDKPAPNTIIQLLREKIKVFQPYLPILYDLINPDLKPSQIGDLSKDLGIFIPEDLNVTLQELIDIGILDHIERINERSTYATGQKKLAANLEKFKEKFRYLRFEAIYYKDSNMLILKDCEPIVEEVDTLLTKIVGISTSKFAKFLTKEIQTLWTNLSRAQEIIDVWLKVQKLITQQQQIFATGDLKKQLADEYPKYESVEKQWRQLLDQVKQSGLVYEITIIPKLKESMQKWQTLLEEVNKSLNNYLNTKRDAFPRFYFVSNEELTMMLAQSGDPVTLGTNYIQQIFEGIKKINFSIPENSVCTYNQSQTNLNPEQLASNSNNNMSIDDKENENINENLAKDENGNPIENNFYQEGEELNKETNLNSENNNQIKTDKQKQINENKFNNLTNKILSKNIISNANINKNKYNKPDESISSPPQVTIKILTGMISEQGEIVDLKNPITPYDEVKNEDGEINFKATILEKWLIQLEREMQSTVRVTLIEAYKDLIKEDELGGEAIKREDWAGKWFEQAVLTMTQLNWTQKTTLAINEISENKNQNALQNLYKIEHENLLNLIKKIRSGKLSKILKKTFVSLIIQDVHANDVLKYMIDNDVKTLSAFEWISQLRYYFSKGKENEGYLTVKMLNTERAYDYEYLGNQKRLVITPLTDRCYRTMMEALNNSLGGAPEGPAGTGKTETIKDLSKNLGKKCFTYNCSEESDYNLMTKFFKGISMSGSWVCFDEFNRISVDVLSVIAHQISVLLTALKTKNTHVIFEDIKMPLNLNLGIFITMNPDYAGRSELPDNLKGSFRPLAMMIPNYDMITEIMLYSFGFNNARALARKIVSSLKLASEQLSSQTHYDYGMRTLNGIITYIGILSQERKEKNNNKNNSRKINDLISEEKKYENNKEKSILDSNNDNIKNTDGNSSKKSLNNDIENCNKNSTSNINSQINQLSRKNTINLNKELIPELISQKMDSSSDSYFEESNLNEILSEEEIKSLEQSEEEFIVQKAIRDSNMPKFIADDYKIYQGILSDLFPNGEFHDKKDKILIKCIKEKISKNQLTCSDYLITKILDFNNIMSVRHAIMIVGDPMASKSTILKIYIEAAIEYFSLMKLNRIIKHDVINPKSITSKQLFGYVNRSLEFVEGVCSKSLRDFFADLSNDLKLLVFDGPVDTMWIENMNSVLDDTKKLCLENSDQIRLDDKTLIIFEVDDLSQASLATISRCGMVYTDRNLINSFDYFYSWMNTFPMSYQKKKSNFLEFLANLFEYFYVPLINNILFDEYNNINIKLNIPMNKNWMMKNFIQILESLIFCNQKKSELIDLEEDKRKDNPEASDNKLTLTITNSENNNPDNKNKKKQITKTEKNDLFNKFIASLIYSTCWLINSLKEQKDIYNSIFEIAENNMNKPDFALKDELRKFLKIYADKDLLNHVFSLKDNGWICITEYLNNQKNNLITKFGNKSTFVIDTHETFKANYFIKLALTNELPLLLFGNTGSGKSLILKDYLIQNKDILEHDNWTNYTVILNSKTTANNLCDLIEDKICFKLKKNTVAPQNNKYCILQIEDLNMPNKEKFGAQPPIEILRQYFDYGGWFDRKEKEFLYLKNLLIFSCLTIGRPIVSGRLLWHFIPLQMREMEDNVLKDIYSIFFSAKFPEFLNTIKRYTDTYVNSIVNAYTRILNNFKPLPATPHYSFNLRDLNKIFEGLTMLQAETLNKCEDPQKIFFNLIIHEMQRVFQDRLINTQDREKFCDNIIKEIYDHSKKDYKTNFHELILFSDINEYNTYNEIENVEIIRELVYKQLEEFNFGKKQKDKLDLILFDYSLKHLMRIDRILNIPGEHGLLIGLTGSGRQSLCNLSAFIKSYKIFKIKGREEVEEYGRKEWLEDIKTLFLNAGLKKENTIFVCRDTSLIEESFYVDLNCIISSGIVYNLFSFEEKSELLSNAKQMKEIEVLNLTDDQAIFEVFISQTINRMRVVLCINPLNQNFAKILRSFPALINNTTIDWYEAWPEPALYYLAKREFTKPDFFDVLAENEKNEKLINEKQLHSLIKEKEALEAIEKEIKKKMLLDKLNSGIDKNTIINEDDEFNVNINTEFDNNDEKINVNNLLTAHLEETSSKVNLIDIIYKPEEKILQKIENISKIFSSIYSKLIKSNEDYCNISKKKVIILPKSFLDFVFFFKTFYLKFYSQIDSKIKKYSDGYSKIEEAEEEIKKMRKLLVEKNPILEEKSKFMESTIKEIETQTREAEEFRITCAANEQIALEAKREAENKKFIADNNMNEAEILKAEINKKIMSIDAKQFMELRSFRIPPKEITKMMQGVTIIMSNFDKKPMDIIPKEWDFYKKKLNDVKLLKNLESLAKKLETNLLQDKILTQIEPYLKDPDLDPVYMEKKISSASASFCIYFRCMVTLDKLMKEKIIPSIRESEDAKANFSQAQEKLEIEKKNLQEIEDKLAKFTETFNKKNLEKQQLEFEITESKKKLQRATRLTSSLTSERSRWLRIADEGNSNKKFFFGNTIISAFYISFMGPYVNSFREEFISKNLFGLLNENEIFHNNISSVSKIIGNPFQIQDWIINGLPSDSGSIDNAIILFETNKQTLLIDPQKQAYKFMEKLYKNDFVLYRKTEDSNENFKFIENCIKNGKVLIFDYISFDIPPETEPFLNMDIVVVNGQNHLNLNDNVEVFLHPNFKVFFICYLTNPSFNPELYGRISIINFSVTKSGLTEQLLSVIINQEAPAEEIERMSILQKQSLLNETINKMESEILEKLNVSNETLLDNDSLILSLEESKRLSDEAIIQIASSKSTEERIEKFRMGYFSLAKLATLLFFTICEMYYVEEIYQFSITWFIKDNLIKAIKDIGIQDRGHLDKRVELLKKNLLKTSYNTICRSLLNKDKILLSFLLLLRYLQDQEIILNEELQFLFSDMITENIPDVKMKEQIANKPEFMDKIKWEKIIKLDTLKEFKGIYQEILDNLDNWKEYANLTDEIISEYNANIINDNISLNNTSVILNINNLNLINTNINLPINTEMTNIEINTEVNKEENKINEQNKPLEKSFEILPNENLNKIHCVKKLLILKIFHPDKLIFYAKKYISEILSEKLAQIPLYSLNEMLDLSMNSLPLMLLMTPGLDPSNDVRKLSEESGKELYMISLGQGQTEKALKSIKFCQDRGHWVYLQNLHLVPHFMKNLENIINNMSIKEKDISPQFRLWISALPSNNILSSILVNSLKMTLESPIEIKANITKLLNSQKKVWDLEIDYMKQLNKDYEYAKFLMSLMHFHSILLIRKNYGPLGWNIKYSFNDSDFLISKNILKFNLEKSLNSIPYKAIIYLTADCIYGGRVTDDWDRRTLFSILNDFYNENVLRDETYKINNLDDYVIPYLETHEDYLNKINNYPNEESPALIGLHKNALIRRQVEESNSMLIYLAGLEKGNSSEGNSKISILNNVYQLAHKKLVKNINIEDVKKKFPIIYEDCMNSILIQEIMRYNKLLGLVFRSLEEIIKAYKGFIPLTDEIEEISNQIISNLTPGLWIKSSYPSKKPIASWIDDLSERLNFFNSWINDGLPNKFWFSAFYFTQSFLTGIKQNYARKNKISIDQLEFNCRFIDNENTEKEFIKDVLTREAYSTYGLFIEGAEWNLETHLIDELRDKNVNSQMPTVNFLKPNSQKLFMFRFNFLIYFYFRYSCM